MKEQAVFEKGKLNGRWIKYYETGAIKRESWWKQGQTHGLSRGFNEDGSMTYQGCTIKGKKAKLESCGNKTP